MNDLVVVRIDRKAIPVDERLAFSVAADTLAKTLAETAVVDGDDLVVISTCERFEVYFREPNARFESRVGATPLADHVLRSRGEDAVRHLFRIAAGLESRIPGEPHVLGQVRAALDCALERGTARREMTRTFRAALEGGRRVRASVPFGPDANGYASRAIDRLREELGSLDTRAVLLVGTGSLAAEVARLLGEAGVWHLTIAGRHEGRVADMARIFGAHGLPLALLPSSHGRFDAIIAAVSSAVPVIDAVTVHRCGARVVIDLGAAPNVDSAVRSVAGVVSLGLDDLVGGSTREATLARAEAVLERELVRYHAAPHVPVARASRLRAAS